MNKLGKKESTQKDLISKLWSARHFIDDNLMEEYGVPDIAREATLSEFHFSRCFKQIFGVSPYQYYLGRKMHRSAQMLLSSAKPLSAIAFELGFSELSTFSKSFKKAYGLSPRQYKKLHTNTSLPQPLEMYNMRVIQLPS